jgi:GTP-binding protein HflX
VGYTSAGKSTLLNLLSGADVYTDARLFATLDPTTRRVVLPDGWSVLLTDTVGFIRNLPHHLVAAFRATLEEVVRADALLEVVDLADPHASEHRRTVQTVLDELGAGHKPRILVLNKSDLMPAGVALPAGLVRRDDQHVVRASATFGQGMDELKTELAKALADLWVDIDLNLPYSAGELLARVRERGSVTFEYVDEDVHVKGRVPPDIAAELRASARAWERARREQD